MIFVHKKHSVPVTLKNLRAELTIFNSFIVDNTPLKMNERISNWLHIDHVKRLDDMSYAHKIINK